MGKALLARKDFRGAAEPLNNAERANMSRTGVCLGCHTQIPSGSTAEVPVFSEFLELIALSRHELERIAVLIRLNEERISNTIVDQRIVLAFAGRHERVHNCHFEPVAIHPTVVADQINRIRVGRLSILIKRARSIFVVLRFHSSRQEIATSGQIEIEQIHTDAPVFSRCINVSVAIVDVELQITLRSRRW